MEQFSKNDIKDLEAAKGNAEKILSIVKRGNPSDRSLIVRYSKARSYLAKYTKNKATLDKLLPPRELSKRVSEEDRRRRDNQTKITVTKTLVDKLFSLKVSNDLYSQCIHLLFVTGRRTAELINASFTAAGEYINIDGVLKRSDDGKNCKFRPILSVKETIAYVRKFQKQYKQTYDNGDVALFRRSLNRHIKRILGRVVHPHMLRGIYVNYMYKFRNKENKKINTFIMDELCHETVTTSMNYTGYEIAFDEDVVS